MPVSGKIPETGIVLLVKLEPTQPNLTVTGLLTLVREHFGHSAIRQFDHIAIILTYNQSFDYIFHLKTIFLNSNLKERLIQPTQPNLTVTSLLTLVLEHFGHSAEVFRQLYIFAVVERYPCPW